MEVVLLCINKHFVLQTITVKVLPADKKENGTVNTDQCKEEVITPLVELPEAIAVHQLLQQGHSEVSINGIVAQNGTTTLQVNHLFYSHTLLLFHVIQQTSSRAATGEEVPQTVLLTTRTQYGLPDDAIVYCNFNQLYKIDPTTMRCWCNVSYT